MALLLTSFSLLCFCAFFFFCVIVSVYCAAIAGSSAEARRNYRKKPTKTLFMGLTIASLNVRRLRDNIKRREVFNGLRKKKLSFYPCPRNLKQRLLIWMIAPFVQLPAVGHLLNSASLPRLPFKSELHPDADVGTFVHLLAYSRSDKSHLTLLSNLQIDLAKNGLLCNIYLLTPWIKFSA